MLSCASCFFLILHLRMYIQQSEGSYRDYFWYTYRTYGHWADDRKYHKDMNHRFQDMAKWAYGEPVEKLDQLCVALEVGEGVPVAPGDTTPADERVGWITSDCIKINPTRVGICQYEPSTIKLVQHSNVLFQEAKILIHHLLLLLLFFLLRFETQSVD